MTQQACGTREGDTSLDDRRLIDAAMDGDFAAFDALVESNWRKVGAVVRQFVRDPNEVEDAIQETFVRAFSSLNTFRRDSSIQTWLLRIAINLCSNRRKSFWNRWVVSFDDDSQHAYRAVRMEQPVEVAISTSDSAELHAAIDRLPEKYRLPLALHYFEDMKGSEIAAALGWNESTVWSRIYAGCRQLRKSLAGWQE